MNTDCFSGLFIKNSPERVASELLRWHHELDCEAEAVRISSQLCDAQAFLDDRMWMPDRAILARVAHDWCAFFNNHRDGFLPQAEIYTLCKRLRVDTCFFYFNDKTDDPNRGNRHFAYYSSSGNEPNARELILYNENGWTFSERGSPLQFEELDAYKSTRKKDRLTIDRLKHYGTAIGFKFWEASAYGEVSHLLHWSNTPTHIAKAKSQIINLVTSVFGSEFRAEVL